jgi:hypothetical protein
VWFVERRLVVRGQCHHTPPSFGNRLLGVGLEAILPACSFCQQKGICYTASIPPIWKVAPLEKRLARSYQIETPPQVRKSSRSNQLPRDLILALMVQGYPLEEILEFFPMFTLDQLMLLLDEDIIH